MKKTYEELELEVIAFETEDIICESIPDPDEGGGMPLGDSSVKTNHISIG